MTDDPQETEAREDRDRSDEAHWRVAEEGAEDEPNQKTEKGLETPVPKREGTDASDPAGAVVGPAV